MAAENNWQCWVWVKWKNGAPSNAWEGWKGNPLVVGAWSTQGEWDACLWLNAHGPAEVEDFIWRNIRHNEWVGATSTSWAKRWW
jgi:hypothetical protein